MRLLLATVQENDKQSIAHVLNEAGLGWEMVWAANGPDVLNHLQANRFDLIYFDLPHYDLFSQVINQNLNIPLLFVTDTGNERQAREALAMGADDYLLKDAAQQFLELLPSVIQRMRRRWEREQIHRQTTRALHESGENYRATLEALGDATHVVDTELRLVFFSQTFKRWNRIFGLETEVVGKTIFDVFPFLPAKVADEYRWVFETGRILVTSEQIDLQDIHLFTETRKVPLFENERVSRVLTLVREITERVEVNVPIEQRGPNPELARKMVYLGSWETDLVTGKVVWSGELQRTLGVDPADFGHDFLAIIKKIIHPDDLNLLVNTLLQEIGEAIKANPTIEDAIIALPVTECRIVLPDGAQRVVWVEGNVIFRAGYPVETIGTLRDITTQRNVEYRFKQQTAQLEALRQLGLEITAQLDLDMLLHSIVSRAMELVGGATSALYLYLPEQDVLQLSVSVGPDSTPAKALLQRGEGLAGKVWETGHPLIIDDYQHWTGRADVFADSNWTAVVGVPIRWGLGSNKAEFLGVLNVLGRPPRVFSPADVDLLSMFATQAAIIIRNVRLYEETRRRSLEQETVSRIARALNTLDVEDAFPVLREGLQNLTQCDRVNLALLDRSAGQTGMDISFVSSKLLEVKKIASFANTVAAENLRAGKPYVSWNLAEEIDYPTERALFEAGLRSGVSLPMLVGNEVIGSLNLGSRRVGHFQPAQLPVMQQIADAVASAIKNSQLYKIEQRKREEADTLREAALALTTALHQNEVIERILAQLQQVVPYDTCSVQLFRPGRGSTLEGGQLEIVGGRGFKNMAEIMGATFRVGWANPNTEVVRSRAPVIVDDAPAMYQDFLAGPHAKSTIRSWMGVPMLLGNRLVGMFTLDKAEPKFYTQEHAQLAEAFAVQAAVAIENARLYEEAQQQGEMLAVLLNEVNHRVKNNLTGIIGLLYVIRSRAKVDDQASYQATMDELIGRVRGLASVHTMLSESQWTPLRLTDLAYEIIQAALRALPYEKQVVVDIPPSAVRVTSDQAHNLALVINELATNSVKYAVGKRDSARITFRAELDERMICCEFCDDGPGYPDEVLRLERHSVGFDLIQNIVKSNLHGDFLLHNQQGAVAVIKFKAEV